MIQLFHIEVNRFLKLKELQMMNLILIIWNKNLKIVLNYMNM